MRPQELSQQPGLDPLVGLVTLPVRPMPKIPGATDQILQPRPDLIDAVLTILGKPTEALLDFSGPADLAAWLAKHSG